MFIKYPNPYNIPKYIETAYERQNKNINELFLGIERIKIRRNINTITVEKGAVIDLNNNTYKLNSDISLTAPNSDLYYVQFNEDTTTVILTTNRGTWNKDKQGYYNENNRIFEVQENI